MTIAPFKNVGDELLVRGIHGNKAAKAAEEIIASSADYDDATLAKARAILAACNAVGAQINEAAYELIAALGAAGVKARRVGSGSSAQFPLFRLSISPDQLEAALTVAETTGYVGAEKLSSGARAALKHAGRILILMRPDETCMRVSLHWRNGPSLLPARLAPDAVDAATLNLPSALWPAYIVWRPVRLALKRLANTDVALRSDAIRPEAHLFTPDSLIEPLLDALDLGPGQRFLDIGCGDGRIVAAAARRGLDAHGVEMNGVLAARADAQAKAFDGSGRMSIRHGAVSSEEIARADGVFLFQPGQIFPSLLKTTLKSLKPGARIISHEQSAVGRRLPVIMQPTRTNPIASADALTVAYLWQR